jgi:hypothetical protein
MLLGVVFPIGWFLIKNKQSVRPHSPLAWWWREICLCSDRWEFDLKPNHAGAFS